MQPAHPTAHPKEWIIPMLRTWRVQYLRAATGRRVFPDGHVHVDGWPTATVLGRIRAEGDGASQRGTVGQHFAEVYTGEALLVWRGMFGMPIAPKEVLFAKTLARDPVRLQAQMLGLKTSAYWSLLDNAYYYLAGRILAIENTPNNRNAGKSGT
jgi:hypothetical protein